MTSRLKNKIALITGASRGIGAAVAKRFAQEGAQVILIARSAQDLEQVDDEIQKYGPPAVLVPFDLMDLSRIDDLAKSIGERFGRLDILVGNAGVLGGLTPMTHIKPTLWHQTLTLNLSANWHLLRACEPLLDKSESARLIFLTSEVAKDPIPYWGAYAVSKLALEMMTRIYALEVDHKGFKANLIEPGSIATDMCAEWMPGEDPSILPKPEDITEAFVCLAESSCPYNGEIINAQDERFR